MQPADRASVVDVVQKRWGAGAAVAFEPFPESGPEQRTFRARVTVDDRAIGVVAKVPGPPHPWNGDRSAGLRREAQALALLDPVVGGELVPHFVGASPHAGVVVTGAIDSSRNLAATLLDPTHPEASEDLAALGSALGSLHALAPLAAVREQSQLSTIWTEELSALVASSRGMFEQFGMLERNADLVADLTAWRAFLEGPERDRTLTHGDACPDNVLLVDGGACLIDFENAGLRPASLDLVFLTMPFPSCWCCGGIPDSVQEEAVASYVSTRRAHDPSWNLDPHEHAMATVYWVLRHVSGPLMTKALAHDLTWGPNSLRARLLAEMDLAVGALERSGNLAGLARGLSDLRFSVVAGWGERKMPPMPCFSDSVARS